MYFHWEVKIHRNVATFTNKLIEQTIHLKHYLFLCGMFAFNLSFNLLIVNAVCKRSWMCSSVVLLLCYPINVWSDGGSMILLLVRE